MAKKKKSSVFTPLRMIGLGLLGISGYMGYKLYKEVTAENPGMAGLGPQRERHLRLLHFMHRKPYGKNESTSKMLANGMTKQRYENWSKFIKKNHPSSAHLILGR